MIVQVSKMPSVILPNLILTPMLWDRMEKRHYSHSFPNKKENQDSEVVFDLSNLGLEPRTSRTFFGGGGEQHDCMKTLCGERRKGHWKERNGPGSLVRHALCCSLTSYFYFHITLIYYCLITCAPQQRYWRKQLRFIPLHVFPWYPNYASHLIQNQVEGNSKHLCVSFLGLS